MIQSSYSFLRLLFIEASWDFRQSKLLFLRVILVIQDSFIEVKSSYDNSPFIKSAIDDHTKAKSVCVRSYKNSFTTNQKNIGTHHTANRYEVHFHALALFVEPSLLPVFYVQHYISPHPTINKTCALSNSYICSSMLHSA